MIDKSFDDFAFNKMIINNINWVVPYAFFTLFSTRDSRVIYKTNLRSDIRAKKQVIYRFKSTWSNPRRMACRYGFPEFSRKLFHIYVAN